MTDRIKQYEDFVRSTAIHPNDTAKDGINYCVLKLCGESGEVAEKWGKLLRDQGGRIDTLFVNAMSRELSDVAWYLTRLSSLLGFTLSEIMDINEAKLKDRQKRGVLGGSGDTR